MGIARFLFVVVNLVGAVFPLAFALSPSASAQSFASMLTWPLFGFCVWGGWRGAVRYEGEDGDVVQLDVHAGPVRYWFGMGMTSLAAWFLMLAMLAGVW
jgi:hypothetical protein